MTERETEVGSTFRFISVCTLFFKTNVAKDKQEFSLCFIFVQSFVARCCKMRCAQPQNNLKGH